MATATRKTDNAPGVTVKSVASLLAKRTSIDEVTAGKRLRAIIRRDDVTLRKEFAWPPKEKAQADGNRYTPMPRKCAEYLLKRATSRVTQDAA